MDPSELCPPALLYFVASIFLMCVLCLVGMYYNGIITGGISSSSGSSCQLSFICLSTFILGMLCNVSPIISWVFVGLWICSVSLMLIGVAARVVVPTNLANSK